MQGKTVSIYLSDQLDRAITKVAKIKGVSKSKLISMILHQVMVKKNMMKNEKGL